MDSVDLPVMDVECNLGDLLLPGIKALQIPFVVPHIPALTHTLTHSYALHRHSYSQKQWLASGN